MNKFIAGFHFTHPDQKLTPEWCQEVINYHYYNDNNRSLIDGKNEKEIEQYSNGEFDMTPFKRMYKSMARHQDEASNPNMAKKPEPVSLDWTCLPLIPTKLNSAISIVQKIPVEISCTALDPLAQKKKEEDINFLKNKPVVEQDLQEIADQMQLGVVDIGGTVHSSRPFSDSPFGLDLEEPDELDIFINILYSLKVETAFETALQVFWELKNANAVKGLEIRDQFKWGVSVHQAFQSSMTGLPDVEYVFPGDIYTPPSKYPDFRDNTHRFMHKRVTAMEMFNFFSNEIGSEGKLDELLNAKKTGYCACNNVDVQDKATWSTFKVDLVYFEVKTVDWVGVVKKKKSKFEFLTMDESQATEKIWGQNTYSFWWLKNTKHFFRIERLGFAHRTKGMESFQNFSTNIYKTQEKSAVELSIGENKKAQSADIKLQHAIVKSVPSGKYIDLRFLRGAASSLKEYGDQYSLEKIIQLAFEQNYILGDTDGWEGKNDGQFKPFEDIPGGLKSEVEGYFRVIAEANRNIENFTGINSQLTGQGANPEGLVGMQKLLINQSINALWYANEAIKEQYQNLISVWASVVKQAIEEGGDAKKAIIGMIGSKKVSVIGGIDEIPLHTMGIKVDISQRELEEAKFERTLTELKNKQVITSADEFLLMYVPNPKDRFALLAVKEKKFNERMERESQRKFEETQRILAQQGQQQMQNKQVETEGELKKIYAKGDVESRIIELSEQLGLQRGQFEAATKKALQQDRSTAQVNKAVRLLQEKNSLQNQQPVV